MKIFRLIILSFSFLYAQQAEWQTYYEKSNFKESPDYIKTIEFSQKLANASAMINYTTFGKSPQGRDLPLLIIDKNGNRSVDQVRESRNVVILIQAGIHSGEIDGKDAGFMLIRDIVIAGKDIRLLDNVTILFIPIFNVDGHERSSPYSRINQNGPEEMGWRTTAQNYNLNRDYLKADSPEMQAWLNLFNTWLPEFFVDCHVTNGADYQYAVTYDIDQIGRIAPNLIQWTINDYLPDLKNGMQKLGFPLIEYVAFKEWGNPASGLKTGSPRPRYSTGYTPLHNRPGLLIETHMLKDYKTRVTGTYHMLKETIKILNRDFEKLKAEIAKADSQTAGTEFREKPYALTYKELNDSSMINFLGYKYSVEKSSLSGGKWYRYSKDTATFKIPFYDSYAPLKTVSLPEAYIIPVEWTNVIDRLTWHGIHFERLKISKKIKIKTYRFSKIKWAEKPYENHHTLAYEVDEIEAERNFPAGSVVIPLNQRTAKVIAHLLEAEGPGPLVFWGFFDSIFEQKEYAEDYVMEEYARFMLSSDAQLKNEFENKLKTDSTFAKNPQEILNWFYMKSPFWDNRINIYPVGKIYDDDVLKTLLN